MLSPMIYTLEQRSRVYRHFWESTGNPTDQTDHEQNNSCVISVGKNPNTIELKLFYYLCFTFTQNEK